MNEKLRVLIVDDSAFVRRRLTRILGEAPDLEVVGSAEDGLHAVHQVKRLRPDVVTMDIEMPVMDGISAVRRIMREVPTPILMFSALTQEGARATLDALEAGAVDFLPKNFGGGAQDRQDAAENALRNKVLAVKRCRLQEPGTGRGQAIPSVPGVRPQPGVVPAIRDTAGSGNYRLVAIGASTGGPVALQTILGSLPAEFPVPLVAVVHMPASFTPTFAERLDSLCKIKVSEARDGVRLRAGQALLAPGGKQLIIEKHGDKDVVRIKQGAADQTYKPSVDITLGSAARSYPGKVLAVVLTGMGSDGKQGAGVLKSGGSTVWSQDEESSVVYGMPQAVEKAGLSDRVLPLSEIGPMLRRCV